MLRTADDDTAAWLACNAKFSALAVREIAYVAIAEIFDVWYIADEDAPAGADHAGILAYYFRLLGERRVEDGYSWGHFMTADEKVLEIFGDVKREWIIPV